MSASCAAAPFCASSSEALSAASAAATAPGLGGTVSNCGAAPTLKPPLPGLDSCRSRWSSVMALEDFAAFFFCSRARRAASATDESCDADCCACASCDCANGAIGRQTPAPSSAAITGSGLKSRMDTGPRYANWGNPQNTPDLLRRQSSAMALCEIRQRPWGSNAKTLRCVLSRESYKPSRALCRPTVAAAGLGAHTPGAEPRSAQKGNGCGRVGLFAW